MTNQIQNAINANIRQNEAMKKAAEKAADLPALQGTEKQIAWAESIRAEAAIKIELLKDMINTKAKPEVRDMLIGYCDAALAQTSASAWIDSRNARYDMGWLQAQHK